MGTKTLVEIEFLPISEIGEAQLRNLVENKVPESQTLEFKRAAVGTRDTEKHEFLKDVSALANTAGGLLIMSVQFQARLWAPEIMERCAPPPCARLRPSRRLHGLFECRPR